jgi:Cu/Ag efflux pump CusA
LDRTGAVGSIVDRAVEVADRAARVEKSEAGVEADRMDAVTVAVGGVVRAVFFAVFVIVVVRVVAVVIAVAVRLVIRVQVEMSEGSNDLVSIKIRSDNLAGYGINETKTRRVAIVDGCGWIELESAACTVGCCYCRCFLFIPFDWGLLARVCVREKIGIAPNIEREGA